MTEYQDTIESGSPVVENDLPSQDDEMVDNKAVEQLQAELDKMKDQLLRTVADMENNRRRAAREREEMQKFALTSFAREILSVADNLKRALDNCSTKEELPESTKALLAGIEMTETDLLNILERHGIKKINPLNEKFDPNFHQAMGEIETIEQEAGKIIQVMQHGYILHERLLRPALVIIAKSASK